MFIFSKRKNPVESKENIHSVDSVAQGMINMTTTCAKAFDDLLTQNFSGTETGKKFFDFLIVDYWCFEFYIVNQALSANTKTYGDKNAEEFLKPVRDLLYVLGTEKMLDSLRELPVSIENYPDAIEDYAVEKINLFKNMPFDYIGPTYVGKGQNPISLLFHDLCRSWGTEPEKVPNSMYEMFFQTQAESMSVRKKLYEKVFNQMRKQI